MTTVCFPFSIFYIKIFSNLASHDYFSQSFHRHQLCQVIHIFLFKSIVVLRVKSNNGIDVQEVQSQSAKFFGSFSWCWTGKVVFTIFTQTILNIFECTVIYLAGIINIKILFLKENSYHLVQGHGSLICRKLTSDLIFSCLQEHEEISHAKNWGRGPPLDVFKIG